MRISDWSSDVCSSDLQMVTHRREAVSPRVGELLEGRRNRELHRDHAGAARGAFGAFVTIALGCALWIGSGWMDGGTAVLLAGVLLSLLAWSAQIGSASRGVRGCSSV